MSSFAIARAIVVTAAAAVAVTGVQPAGASAPSRVANVERTAYAMSAGGFGARLSGGEVPVSSGGLAHDAIGCTNKAGLAHGNHVESVDLAGLGTASGVSTRVSTARAGSRTTVVSSHSVAEISLADTALGTVSIKGVTSTARAWHGRAGFGSDAKTTVSSVTLTPVSGSPVALEVPTPGHPLTVPGLLTLSVGKDLDGAGGRGAWARSHGLVLSVPGQDTEARLARSKAAIGGGVKAGLFRGSSYAVDAQALSGTSDTRRQPLTLMPCQGTHGVIRSKSVAVVDLGRSILVKELSSRQVADQSDTAAWGRKRSSVARVEVAEGAVVVSDIVAQARVVRGKHGVTRSARGTGIGQILVAGREVAMPESGVLTVPGLVRLETKVVSRKSNGISVVGLRLTLLDGSGAVVDLARASLQVSSSGR